VEQSTPSADRSDEREPEIFHIRLIASRPPTIWKTQKKGLNDLKFKAGHEENFKFAKSVCITDALKLLNK
jgi:hypothetical protein